MKDRGGGEGTGSRSNNLVYTKRQKQINAISTHETTTHTLRLNPSLSSVYQRSHETNKLFITNILY